MDFFIFDAGTSTVGCFAEPAFLIRVSISAMGSVICMDTFSSLLELQALTCFRGEVSMLILRRFRFPPITNDLSPSLYLIAGWVGPAFKPNFVTHAEACK